MIEHAIRYPHLMKLHLFHGMSRDEKAQFLNRCTARYCSRDELILSQGMPSPGLFIIAHGSIEVSYSIPNGQVVIIRNCIAGEMVGETEALGETHCTADCLAKAESTLLFMSTAGLLEELKNIDFVRNLFAGVAVRMAQDNFFKAIDQSRSVDQKICAYLYQFSARNDVIVAHQGYLAECVGCSRQKMNRMLGALRDEGIVKLGKGKITVRDRAELARRLQLN